MDKLPFVKRYHQPFLPLYPLALKHLTSMITISFSATRADFATVSSHRRNTAHLLLFTPTRYLWNYRAYLEREGVVKLAQLPLVPFVNYLRLWDRLAAERVDHFIAISQAVKRRVAKYYRRDSAVIHPPVNTSHLEPSADHDNYFLVVSRLIPYKRIDLAVQAFNELALPLVIIGDGRDRSKLEALARPNITFLGHLPTAEVQQHLRRCRAFVFPDSKTSESPPSKRWQPGARSSPMPEAARGYGRGGNIRCILLPPHRGGTGQHDTSFR